MACRLTRRPQNQLPMKNHRSILSLACAVLLTSAFGQTPNAAQLTMDLVTWAAQPPTPGYTNRGIAYKIQIADGTTSTDGWYSGFGFYNTLLKPGAARSWTSPSLNGLPGKQYTYAVVDNAYNNSTQKINPIYGGTGLAYAFRLGRPNVATALWIGELEITLSNGTKKVYSLPTGMTVIPLDTEGKKYLLTGRLLSGKVVVTLEVTKYEVMING